MDTCNERDSQLPGVSGGTTTGGRTRRCPECGKHIPQKSVFCPHCGKMVWNDMAEDEPPMPEKEANAETTPPPKARPAATADTPRHKTRQQARRNRIITTVLVIAVLCAAVYGLYDWGGGGDTTTNPYVTLTGTDTTAHAEPQRMNVVEATSIYGSTLVHDNRIGDKSVQGSAAYTLLRGRPLIVGINFFSGEKQRSFIKLTTLHKEDGRWHCGQDVMRDEDGGIIEMDRDKLKIAGENIPRFEQIDGKNYFYFVYLVKPAERLLGTAAKHHLRLALFNIESNDIVQLDYECEPVMANGTTLYYGKVSNRRETPEFEFLDGELGKLPIVHHPTPEEVEMASPANASRKWMADNDSIMDLMRNGKQEATLTLTRYEKPLFSRSDVDMDTKVATETYIYYVTHGGTVFGYNHITKKFFIAYVDDRNAQPQIEINSNGTLHVKAPSVDFDLDPDTGKATLN